MTRRKIEIKKIENEDYRKVTFSKRRAGLIKKAKFLCSGANTQIAIVSYSLSGRLFTFGNPSVDSVVDQFLDNYTTDSCRSSSNESPHVITHGPSPPSSGVVDGKEGRPSWWALPVEDMDLDMDVDGLRQYKASLEILKSNVASRLKEMDERASLTRDFVGFLDAR
ncbi:PREDICTED: agamous-like MADS-box protein AGL61 [Populus euphratica]|uniref:Agamous-like MADS-box protein AGL61 n=1 Tax=Populus euphratica TaxID=75702 RepID=A0AAJ6XPL4_POPEU|nr:PREDICTED: agamous-like MADS-box protein AGL61 [Populus euphratica]